MNILVLGYYNRQNLGDDLFQHILTKRFSNHRFEFLNPDDAIYVSSSNPDIILVGGGDLINNYFMTKIIDFVTTFERKIPVYAIGIGFPYPQLITQEYLSGFDYIQTRTYSVRDKLSELFPNRCSFKPDIVRYNNQEPKIKFNTNEPKKIGIFLANSINSDVIINKITKVIQYIADIGIQKTCKKTEKSFSVHLYAMNTSGTHEDDRIINHLIYRNLQNYSNVIIHNTPIKVNEIDALFASFYATICTRFHAHILSLNTGIPFVSLYSTNKVRDLLVTEELTAFSESMLIDKRTLQPIDFNAERVCEIFDSLHTFPITKFTISPNIATLQEIENLLYYKPSFVYPRINRIIHKIYKYIGEKNLYKYSPEETAEIITFAITRKHHQEFTYGLIQNLKTKHFNIYNAIEWILNNVPEAKFLPPLDTNIPLGLRKYNFSYFDNNLLSGFHRSGWQYVVDHMKMYHNPKGIIFDSYLDKTFGWNKEFYIKIGILPLKKSWVGVFHHLPDQAYDKNNLLDIVTSDVFIQSLRYCKKLIVMSNFLKTWLERRIIDVPIINVSHPTEFVNLTWKPEFWENNNDKKIIQVGAWMRDPFAIYALPTISTHRKCALKGKSMNNYYPQNNFVTKFTEFCNCLGNEEQNIIANQVICRHKSNKFIVGMYDWIKEALNSVTIISSIEDPDYDILLSKNIIFIKLIDASACNTIIECIVRNTPIIINKLPAVIEYLGPDYPLYYETLNDAAQLAECKEKILLAHEYLKCKDKTSLRIETFLKNVFTV